MVQKWFHGAAAVAALALFLQSPGAIAQQSSSGGWFVPGGQKTGGPPTAAPRTRPAPVPAPVPSPAVVPSSGGLPLPADNGGEQAGLTQQQLQMQLPPAPEIPPIQKGPATPAAIVGILSVPDVLRVSTAYQAAYKELNGRGQKLNEDAQKEQAALREMGQNFANERAKLSPEQIRAKEREIQDRATEAQRKFGERNRIIQEAGQYVMAQINRTMEQVAQQVALSRGINLVLNRAQILGTTADFDLTPAVADVLNKVLPTVVVPPDGVSPMAMAPPASPTGAPGAPALPANAAAAAKPTPAAATPATAKATQKQ